MPKPRTFRNLLQVNSRPSTDGLQRESTPIEEDKSSSEEDKHIEIPSQDRIWSVAFLADGKHFVSGGRDKKIRCWRLEDGKEVGAPMHPGSEVWKLAVSQDGKFIIAGTQSGHVMVWDAKKREKISDFKAHYSWIQALDVSPDGTKVATGSQRDETAHVWSLPTGGQLLDLRHKDIRTIRFSPNGRLLATGSHTPLRIYNSQNGRLFIEFKIYAWSLAWTSDSTQLFVLSADDIYRLDVSSGRTLSTWSIRRDDTEKPYRISLSSNGAFIAVKANSLVSFWDTHTHQQIGIIHHHDSVYSMAMSANYDFVIGGGKKIALWNLRDVLPSRYIDEDANGSSSNARSVPLQNAHRKETNHPLPTTQDEHSNERSVDPDSAVRNYSAATQNDGNLSTVINSLRADLRREVTTSRKLREMVKELRSQLADSLRTAKDTEDAVHSLHRDLTAANANSSKKIYDLEKIVQQLRTQLADSQRDANNNLQRIRTELANSQQKADRLTKILYAHQQKDQCEALFTDGRIIDAAKLLLETMGSASDDVKADTTIKDWHPGFTDKCINALERIGDEALNAKKHDDAISAYAAALSLGPSTQNALLTKWARTKLLHGSTNELLDCTSELKVPRFSVYHALCEVLVEDGRVTEAIEYFRQMQSGLMLDLVAHEERAQWELDFQSRCAERLKKLANVAVNSHNYNEAEEHFSTILSLDTPDRVDILIKRSKARIAMKSWDDALQDADDVIKLDPSSYRGYEWRRVALHGAKRYAEAVTAYDKMLSKLEESSDPRVRELRSRYTDARPIIRDIIATTLSHMPRVLIDTTTGQLLDKIEQAEAFEALPVFSELVSSMMTQVDETRIQREVKKFYRYVMLSHKWQRVEPRYKEVKNVTVYKLKAFLGSIKLQTFCKLVRSLGFRWAWCDTCCIDQENNVVLQESLVAMFAWYRGSSLTIVYLFDIPSSGGLQKSIWNTRAWTYQEYVAAERVQFYSQDWKPYLGLELLNHKESPVVTLEMERASRVSADQLAVLQPGLDRVREKLYLASMRRSTRVEDMAYSLMGIFNVSIPVIYGEGTRAVGRLLEHILTGSGDVKILAWTGAANEYNSCLPMNLTVYSSLVPPHVPYMETAELDRVVADLRTSIPDVSLATTLYSGLHRLPLSYLASTRLQLPCIRFHITNVVCLSGLDPETNFRAYRATTTAFGDVEIRTASKLMIENEHCFVHPWIRPLLDPDLSRSVAGLDDDTRALRLVARLRQPFGALLLEKVSPVVYKRVAADSLIMVQVRKEVSLTHLIDNIDTIYVK